MKIVHILAKAPYTDYWGYQDNLLPKYQAKAGHEVWMLTTNMIWNNNKIDYVECSQYTLNDGVHVCRFARKDYHSQRFTEMFSKIEIYEKLCEIKPDFIFVHGLNTVTIFQVIKYKKKNPNCVIVQDNHLDYNIGYIPKTFKEKVFRAFFVLLNKKTQKHIARVYGVTPWRKTYAEDYYCISSDKTDVLIMGADDEKINFAKRDEIRAEIRLKYGIEDEEFLIVTGGKIAANKKIHLLTQAVKGKEKVKLLVFGKADSDFEEEYKKTLNENVIDIGWIDSDKVYDLFFAADLVIYPGQHSVLWEQTCASKVPCLFEKWEGMDHVNNGGNADFISDVSVEKLSAIIDELHFTEKYYKMKEVALSEKTDIYLYSVIAEKSLECTKIQ